MYRHFNSIEHWQNILFRWIHLLIVGEARRFGSRLCLRFRARKVSTVAVPLDTAILSRWVKVNWSRYRPGVAQRVGRGIVLLFHDRGTRRGWVFSSTPRPHFTPGKEPVPILQEAGWAPGPVWTGGKSRPHRDSIPDHPARRSVAIPTELPQSLGTIYKWIC